MRIIQIGAWVSVLLFLGCNVGVNNPFDDIERPEEEVEQPEIMDSFSISGIHKLILEPKCAIPSCHGGTFEPDYRTPISSFNTMVYRPVIKNDADYTFRYRVVPGDTAASWLHERLLTDDEILGRMPRYMPPLDDTEMRMINRWILEGAKDIYGVPAVKPNNNVHIWGVGIYDNAGNRYDENRTAWAQPCTVPSNTTLKLFLWAWDDETTVEDLTQVKLSFSTDRVNFSNPTSVTAVFDTNDWIWRVNLNTSQFPVGETIYMRYTGTDADHVNSPLMFPNASTHESYMGHYSFKVQ
jgi:hypothetical protein